MTAPSMPSTESAGAADRRTTESLRSFGGGPGERGRSATPRQPVISVPAADHGASGVDPVVRVVCEAGPAAGASVALGVGRHLVGRVRSASVAIADRSIEPHHGLLTVDDDHGVRFVQLTGRVPCRLDGALIDGSAPVSDGAVLVLGASRVRIEVLGSIAAAAADHGDHGDHDVVVAVPVERPPSVSPSPSLLATDPLLGSAAQEAHAPGDLVRVAAVVGAGATAGIATTSAAGAPWYLAVAIAGVLTAIVRRGLGRCRDIPDGRRGEFSTPRAGCLAAAGATPRAAWWAERLAITPGVAAALRAVADASPTVWSRHEGHRHAWAVALGWGPTSREGHPSIGPGSPSMLATELVADAPLAVDLAPGASVAVCGPGAEAVVRSVLVQLATFAGPAAWRLILEVDDTAAWSWCRALPHVDGEADVRSMVDRPPDGDTRHVIVVTDRPASLVRQADPLRRLLDSSSVAVLAVVPAGCPSEAVAGGILQLGSLGTARWVAGSTPGHTDRVHVAGVDEVTATAAARTLGARWRAERPALPPAPLPVTVSLSEVCEQHGIAPIDDSIAIARAWRDARTPSDLVIGLTSDAIATLDEPWGRPDGSPAHVGVVGVTGSGKSDLLRMLVVSLAPRCPPASLQFVLIGHDLGPCAELPHVVGHLDAFGSVETGRAAVSLRRRLEHRDQGRQLLVVVDDLPPAGSCPELEDVLGSIARRAGRTGVHLLAAGCRVEGVLAAIAFDRSSLRIALRLDDADTAEAMVGDVRPLRFPVGRPGRALLCRPAADAVVFQATWSAGSGSLDDATVLARSTIHAAALAGIPSPDRLWRSDG